MAASAVGDRGGMLWFPRPDQPGRWRAQLTGWSDLDRRKHRFDTDAGVGSRWSRRPGELLVGFEEVILRLGAL